MGRKQTSSLWLGCLSSKSTVLILETKATFLITDRQSGQSWECALLVYEVATFDGQISTGKLKALLLYPFFPVTYFNSHALLLQKDMGTLQMLHYAFTWKTVALGHRFPAF